MKAMKTLHCYSTNYYEIGAPCRCSCSYNTGM